MAADEGDRRTRRSAGADGSCPGPGPGGTKPAPARTARRVRRERRAGPMRRLSR